MDTFFGVGISEALLILVIALIVFGPGRLPELAAALGRAVGNLRRATQELTGELRGPIEEARSEIEATMNETEATIKGVQADVEGTVREVQNELQVTIDTGEPGSAATSGPAGAASGATPAMSSEPLDDAERNWLALGTWSEAEGVKTE